jgi:serine/threonine-protein kinase HipA
MKILEVYFKNQLAGYLERTGDDRFIFEYVDHYLGPAISYSLPKETKRFESDELFAFFDGLIPEGWLLNLASQELRLNPLQDRFELLSLLCHDTIGAVHIGQSQKTKSAPPLVENNEEISPYKKCLICYLPAEDFYHLDCMKKVFGREIIPRVDYNEEQLEHLIKLQLFEKSSIAGAQKKASMDFVSAKENRLTLTNLWGKFIFKPRGLAPHLPENEHLCLKLAELSGIQVERSALIPYGQGEIGFIARRFDRGEDEEEFHQEDFCQLTEKLSYKKYSGSIEQIGKIIKKISDYPGDDLFRLYELVIFNFLIGNVDAHLKNISLGFETALGAKVKLTPFYDLISTDLFLKNDPEESALAINGKKNKLSSQDFLALSNSLGLDVKIHNRLIQKFKKNHRSWFQLIDRSFLSEIKKTEFKDLINYRLERLQR